MQLSFSTSAQLAAFPFKPRHIGIDVYDKQAQLAYVCVSAATGLAALAELTGGGGGGLSFSAYWPDAPPASPHVDDNEFDTSIADFTDDDGVASWDIDTDLSRATCTFTRSADNQSSKRMKDTPDSEFSIIAKVGLLVLPKVDCVFGAGIVVAEGSGSSDNFVLLNDYLYRHSTGLGAFNQTQVTAWGVRGNHFSDHDSIVNDDDLSPIADQRPYLRIAVDGDDITLYSSVDGQDWGFMWTTTGLGWTPTKMGLGCWFAGSFGSGTVAKAYWPFFRVKSGAGSSDYDGHQIGVLE